MFSLSRIDNLVYSRASVAKTLRHAKGDTMKTTTRRTILAGAAALPLLPATALAAPADPVVKVYRAWRTAYDANDA